MLAEPRLMDRPFEVLKFPVMVERRVLVLSPLIGIYTHYLERSLVCGGASCPACQRGIGHKYQGYVAVFYDGGPRLLRLTTNAAAVGDDAGIFTPGRVVKVVKTAARRPLTLMSDGDGRDFDRYTVVSRLALLSVVCRLHGLPLLPEGIEEAEARELVERNASTAVGLALAAAER